jgi:peptidyl-prolyl cis-trans isomerase D
VETQFGFHIIKLAKIEPAHTKALEEVKDEIKKQLQAQKAKELAFTKASEAYEKIILAGSLEKFSQNSDIPVEQTEFFPKNSPGKSGVKDDMISNPAFLNAAFSLNKGELSSLIETPKGYAIIFAADKKEPETAPYEEVQGQVRKDYITAQAEIMAKETADTLLNAVKNEKAEDFKTEAGKLDLTSKTSEYLTHGDAVKAGLPEPVVDLAFEHSEKNPYPEEAVAANGMFYVFKVLEKRPPTPELFSEQENEFRTTLLDREKSTILASWLANVRARAKIEINEQFRSSRQKS